MNKLAQVRTALNEAISLSDPHNPKAAILHELIYTLNDLLLAQPRDFEYHHRARKKVVDSSDIYQFPEEYDENPS